jgi:hypothetical protein
MQKLLFPNKLVSALVLLSFGLMSTGFMPMLPAQAAEDSNLEFIPVVVRAESTADYGVSDTQLVIAPMQPAAIMSVLSDNNGDEAAAIIFQQVEDQIEQQNNLNEETSGNGPSQTLTVNTPASHNEPNTDQIPGNGNAYGLDNGNGNGPSGNNGNGPSGNNGNGNVNANANVGNGSVNANANASGNGVTIKSAQDGVSVEINLSNGNGLGLGLGKDDDNGNSNGQNNGNGNNQSNGNGNN